MVNDVKYHQIKKYYIWCRDFILSISYIMHEFLNTFIKITEKVQLSNWWNLRSFTYKHAKKKIHIFSQEIGIFSFNKTWKLWKNSGDSRFWHGPTFKQERSRTFFGIVQNVLILILPGHDCNMLKIYLRLD